MQEIRDTGSIPGSGKSPWGRHGNPLQYLYLENPMDRGAWQVTVHYVTKSWTWLKWLSTRVLNMLIPEPRLRLGRGLGAWTFHKLHRSLAVSLGWTPSLCLSEQAFCCSLHTSLSGYWLWTFVCSAQLFPHLKCLFFQSVHFSHSGLSNSLWPYRLQLARPPCPSPTPGVCLNSCPLSQRCIQPSHPLSSPSPLTLNLSQHQGLFKWVSSSHQVAKVLEFQLQHQSFQWTFRTDFT